MIINKLLYDVINNEVLTRSIHITVVSAHSAFEHTYCIVKICERNYSWPNQIKMCDVLHSVII